jgi:hypothetical protein
MPFRQYATFFEPEQLDRLTAAFNATWEELKASGMDLTSEPQISLVRSILVQRILVSATAGGIRDVETMKEQALRSLRGGVCLLGEKTPEAA